MKRKSFSVGVAVGKDASHVPTAVTSLGLVSGGERFVRIELEVTKGPPVVVGRPATLLLHTDRAAELALAILNQLPAIYVCKENPDFLARLSKLTRAFQSIHERGE